MTKIEEMTEALAYGVASDTDIIELLDHVNNIITMMNKEFKKRMTVDHINLFNRLKKWRHEAEVRRRERNEKGLR
jgi:hypothetical protein